MAERRDPAVRLLLLSEVAAICRVDAVKTVSRWIRFGIRGEKLPASRLGRQWRVHPDDLMAFIKKTRRW